MRGDVDDPALDRVDARRRNPRHGAGIRNPEEDGAARGVGERDQLAGERLGIG